LGGAHYTLTVTFVNCFSELISKNFELAEKPDFNSFPAIYPALIRKAHSTDLRSFVNTFLKLIFISMGALDRVLKMPHFSPKKRCL